MRAEPALSPLERFLREEDTLREIARIRRTAREQATRQQLLELATWAPAFKDSGYAYWARRLSALPRLWMATARSWRRAC
jgi:hypothetical protein